MLKYGRFMLVTERMYKLSNILLTLVLRTSEILDKEVELT